MMKPATAKGMATHTHTHTQIYALTLPDISGNDVEQKKNEHKHKKWLLKSKSNYFSR